MVLAKAGVFFGLATAAVVQAASGWQPGPFFVARAGAQGTHYAIKAPGWAAEFQNTGMLLTHQGVSVLIRFLGARDEALPEARRRMRGRANFFLGKGPDTWRIGMPVYREIVYRALYPGIDLIYGGSAGRLKSEFRVAPNANVSTIRLQYSGVDAMDVDPQGALVVTTAKGVFREEAPTLYQEVAGNKVPVAGTFRVFGDGSVGFTVGEYDHARTLVIDPVIASSTYLGGSGIDAATSVAVDGAGNIYAAGWTDSTDLPALNAFLPQGSGVDAFIAKWNGSGSLLYCTYLGGSGDDRVLGMAVDNAGNVYVTGATASTDFPTMTPLQAKLDGSKNAFVAKLNSTGGLVYSTYLGGSGSDSGNAIAVDSMGNVTVIGDTASNNFPLQNAFQNSRRGQTEVFVTRLSAAEDLVIYSTYLGGSGDDHGTAVALDSSGAAYITGNTTSLDFPQMNALQRAGGGQDAFVTKLASTGNWLVYSTYLGGSGGSLGAPETGSGIAVDASGNAYVTGTTSSANFPIVNALQPNFMGGQTDTFVSKLSPAGNGLIYSTYLGGSGIDYGDAIAVNSQGDAWVTGYTTSTNFPTANAIQPAFAGGYDAFVAALDPTGATLTTSTYLGGSGNDFGNAIALDPWGSAYVAGQTLSSNFPAQNATQPANGGGIDAFVTRLAPPPHYGGSHDTASCSTITGWAWDQSNPNNTVSVDIFDGTTLLATVPANVFRGDLLNAGYGNGYHGFSYTAPNSLKDGRAHSILVRISQTTTNLTGSPKSLTCGALYGVQDAATCSSVSGWAWDPNNPNSAINVDILNGTTLLATVAANMFRGDLLNAGYGNGYHGFSYTAPNSLKDGRAHSILVRISQTTTNLTGSPKSLTCMALYGVHDTSGCSLITGWAWDPNNPNSAINVDILNGTTLLGTVAASVFRSDLLAAGYGNGYHGFSFPTPLSLEDGQAHSIQVRFSKTTLNLLNTPRSLTCTGMAGFHDTASCSTITGWAWNQNTPDTPINVDILDGTTLLATVTANVFRGDLLNAGYGNGYHGFSFATPGSVQNGWAHSILVRYSQTSTPLTNSPKTVQCGPGQ
jgi:Beta-propeller repeat